MSPLFYAVDLSEITIGLLFRTQFACKGTTFFLIMQINCYFFAYVQSKRRKGLSYGFANHSARSMI